MSQYAKIWGTAIYSHWEENNPYSHWEEYNSGNDSWAPATSTFAQHKWLSRSNPIATPIVRVATRESSRNLSFCAKNACRLLT